MTPRIGANHGAKKTSPSLTRGGRVLDLCEGNNVRRICQGHSPALMAQSVRQLAVITVMAPFRNSNFWIKSIYRIDLIITQNEEA